MHCLMSCCQYTNNVVVDFGSVGGVKPALGRTWTYVPATRIMLSRQESLDGGVPAAVRLATVSKSSQQVRPLVPPQGPLAASVIDTGIYYIGYHRQPIWHLRSRILLF